ncbi:metal ABC transporter substrate-binding protein [Anaerosacchariphilus polymeriproducens]|uniref:Zinc ABC transporter substrate-binding protein n=1 Tax=Anaerosacchariphilus polymeriproducens TaxID=1812858 RepID=A0A371AW40_9FIRM|nr:metal ABC transporter substrate-binding protein [Anaerosacchariphilus polymeriproducens]RDU23787.1 zinc ABC transporter substrate-binding protein [Anaerosacchariphilus polymeriproducens]
MRKIYKKIFMLLVCVVMLVALTSCGKKAEPTKAEADNGKLNVVATIFPEYDFLRQIAGDHINLKLLLKPGAESHSYEPTPQEILEIQNSDLFVYVGGETNQWVADILDSMKESEKKSITLMECVKASQKGIQTSETNAVQTEDSNEKELDPHVWTSPKYTIMIVQKLCDRLCEIDPNHAEDYKKNTEFYRKQLADLDHEFQDIVDHAARKEIIVGDRFPFRNFVKAYGLKYYSAFPGCATETEASAETVTKLVEKVKEDKIPVVFHIEFSNEEMCDSICSATGAKKELLHAIHNVSKDDFEKGITYIEIMKQNAKVLREALN